MAMNKKEQAEFDAAKKAVIVARALNWTDPVLPDIPPPKDGLSVGFLFGAHSMCVLYSVSSSVSHASSWDEHPKKTTSQGARSLYSTKLLALKAMRHEMEKDFADRLAKVDMQIADEKAAP